MSAQLSSELTAGIWLPMISASLDEANAIITLSIFRPGLGRGYLRRGPAGTVRLNSYAVRGSGGWLLRACLAVWLPVGWGGRVIFYARGSLRFLWGGTRAAGTRWPASAAPSPILVPISLVWTCWDWRCPWGLWAAPGLRPVRWARWVSVSIFCIGASPTRCGGPRGRVAAARRGRSPAPRGVVRVVARVWTRRRTCVKYLLILIIRLSTFAVQPWNRKERTELNGTGGGLSILFVFLDVFGWVRVWRDGW